MNLDFWIAMALVLFAALGYRSGAIRQLSMLVGMAVGYLCAKPLAAALAPAVAERGGWPPAPTAAGLSVLAMPVILIVTMLIARRIVDAVVPGGQGSKPDRLAGVLVGAGKCAAVAWLLLSIVLVFEQTLAQARPGVKAALDGSTAAAIAREHNLLALAPPSAQERLKSLAAMRNDPKTAEAMLKDPAIAALLSDPAVKQALEKKDPAALLNNPQIKKLLADPELAKKLEAMTAH